MITTTKRQVIDDRCDMTDAMDIQPITRISLPKSDSKMLTIDTDSISTTITPKEEVEVSPKKTKEKKANQEVMLTIKNEKKEKALVLDAKSKMLVVAYTLVAIVLAAIVMSTGLVISLKARDIQSLEDELSVQNAVLASQQIELDKFEDDSFLTGEAVKNGMVQNDNAVSLDLVALGEKVTYDVKTNGFDKFCDFLSKIFG